MYIIATQWDKTDSKSDSLYDFHMRAQFNDNVINMGTITKKIAGTIKTFDYKNKEVVSSFVITEKKTIYKANHAHITGVPGT